MLYVGNDNYSYPTFFFLMLFFFSVRARKAGFWIISEILAFSPEFIQTNFKFNFFGIKIYKTETRKEQSLCTIPAVSTAHLHHVTMG